VSRIGIAAPILTRAGPMRKAPNDCLQIQMIKASVFKFRRRRRWLEAASLLDS